MKVLPKRTITIKRPNVFERAAEIPPKVFGVIPTPLHVPSIIGLAIVIPWTLKQAGLVLKGIGNLFSEDDRKITVIRMNEELKKESEEK